MHCALKIMNEKLSTISKNTLEYLKRAKLEWILFLALLFVDLFSKWLIVHVWGDRPYSIFDNFLYIYYVKNQNAAFGSDFGLSKVFGSGGVRVFFIIFTIIFMLGFCVLLYRWRERRKFARVAVVMIVAGGIGNLVDRIFLHYVRDFISIVFFGKSLPLLGEEFAIFNIADSCLSIGIILFAWYVLFMYEKDGKKMQETVVEEPSTDLSLTE